MPSHGLQWHTIRAVLTCFVVAALMAGCGPREPLLIGFGGPLTGRNADLGNAGLDGVRLALEQQMARGGIHGRRLELALVDDEMDGRLARSRDAVLLDRGIVAMIGHMTSNATVEALPLFNDRGVLLLSPTTSTHEVSGRADWFFRVYPDNHVIAGELGRRAAAVLGLRTAAIIYETSNASFTLSCKEAFTEAFGAGGGKVVCAVAFHTGASTSFGEVARQALVSNPAGLYILANAMDTAMLAQQVAKQGKRPQIMVADWSLTDDLLAHGGRAIEGLFAMHTVDRDNPAPAWMAFREAFRTRYTRSPEFAAVHGYDGARVLLTALERDGRPKELPHTILAIRRFQGVQGEIEFDANGDVKRRLFAIRVRHGQLTTER